VERLEILCREKGQEQHYQLFIHRYLLDADRPPTWREVGKVFELDETIARSRAETAVRHFRGLLRNLIASDLGADEDIDNELQAVIAAL
jgi:hypothetical protein